MMLTDSEAGVFGAGCWAEQSRDGQTGMACSISGTSHRMDLDLFLTRSSGAGEHIMRTGLARVIADVLRPGQDSAEVDVHELLTKTLSTHFHGEFRQINLLSGFI